MSSKFSKYFDNPKSLAILAGWMALFLAAVMAYWPGLAGPFILDDEVSISALGVLGGVRDWETFKLFVFGGTSGPTGRPLALLSFLIDGSTWPTDPWPFKRTNLIIHLINGALLGVLIGKILQLLDFDRHDVRWITLISTAFWVLHPFLVSTTLYAVQRMAQLSTMFIFIGLIGHLYGRSLMARNELYAYLVMSLSLGLFTLLAMLSKENGILLPTLVGVLEFTVLASQRERIGALDRRWLIVFVIAPSLIIVSYLGVRAFSADFFTVVSLRDFSLYERLLTQPRVLVDYLQNWFIPKLYTTGVFQDHFIKSTGIFSPLSTLFSILFHLVMISLAIVNRRKWPLFALAALFFYASHVLESTVLNLEMYFEHRNYVAAAFLFLPLVVLLQKKVSRQRLITVGLVGMLVMGAFTRYSATIWKDFPSMVQASAQKAPTSARAQAQYAVLLFNAGRHEESIQVLDQAIQNIPTANPLLLVNRIIILCNLGFLNESEFRTVASDLSEIEYDARSIKFYTALIAAVAQNRCPDVSMTSLRRMYEDMLLVKQNANPESLGYSHIKYFIGLVNAYLGEPDIAILAFEESLRAEPGADNAMIMAISMAESGYYGEALHLSELAVTLLNTRQRVVSRKISVSENSIREFQALVHADIEATRSGDDFGSD
jgi:tetratricopeptide (TPR) repeat protein